jgi:spermidine/putrescine ABC transporter ATP-binding subunit
VEKKSRAKAVQLKSVVKRFGKVLAVQEIDLDIEEGSFVTLLGPSGCGKTTILRMIAGLETPTEGEIYIEGKLVNDIPIHKRNLGMIFQNYALFPHKNIFDNVGFGLKYKGAPKEEIKKKVRQALEMVRLPGVENRMPAQLSGGQQQRIALARAIVMEPVVLLMDEPLSALDENLREEMRIEIDNLQNLLGITTIFVTHDQREALSMSDKIVVLKDGVMQQEGNPEEVYNVPSNHFVADFLGHSNFFEGTVVASKGNQVSVRLADGSEVVAQHSGEWKAGDRIELVVRAQKFEIAPEDGTAAGEGFNCFRGKITERSYMGGEVGYFVEMGNNAKVHVIDISKSKPLRRGQEVRIQVPADQCGLLPVGD